MSPLFQTQKGPVTGSRNSKVLSTLFFIVFLSLSSGPTMAIDVPSKQGIAIDFKALKPLIDRGSLLLIQETEGGITQVSVVGMVSAPADLVFKSMQNPINHKHMSESHHAVEIEEVLGSTIKYTTEYELPGPNAHIEQSMLVGPGHQLHIHSGGDLKGNYAWNFKDLPGGQTGVEYTVQADMMNMGAVVRWISNRAKSVQITANAVTASVSIRGLNNLLFNTIEVPLPNPGPLAPPPLNDMALKQALAALASKGTVAWIGQNDVLLFAHKTQAAQYTHNNLLEDQFAYNIQMETPFNTMDVDVIQEVQEGNFRIKEYPKEAEEDTFYWTWESHTLDSNNTLLSVHSDVDMSETLIVRLATKIDSTVGPAIRLGAILSPWQRAEN